jgi:hypothetical protein
MFRSLILASGLFISAFSAQADLIVSFGEDNIEVNLNETFTVELFANAASESDAIGSFEFNIDFDISRLEYVDFTLGSLFDSGLADLSGIFRLPSLPPLSPLPTGAVGTSVLLGTLTFKASDYGPVTLRTKNESFKNLLRTVELLDNKSASSQISVVSTPATLGLFAIALVGLVSLRRKA